MPTAIRFSTEITIDGQRVENPPDPVKSQSGAAWLANSIFCPLGPAPTQGWFVMTKRALNQLPVGSSHTVTWIERDADTDAASSLTATTLNFYGLCIVKSERLFPGGEGDLDALYLVELADGRLLAERNSDSGIIQANIRSFANAADYLTGTSGATWESLLTQLWNECPALGTFPGMPTVSPVLDGVPQNTWMIGLNAYRSLNAVLEQLDCAIQPNPLSDPQLTSPFSIVQLGSTQVVPANANTFKWSGEPSTANVIEAAAYLRIYHYFHYKSYGQENDTELADNWAVNSGGPADIATNIANAQGTLGLWDDLPRILDEDNQVSNAAAITLRDNNRLARYVTRHSVTGKHRIHIGLTDSYLPGGQVRGVLWRNYGDGQYNSLGGTVTEFTCGSGLITGFKSNGGSAAWLDAANVTPEREAYAPPDISRHSFPNYPRLPNIVQVWHTGEQAGSLIDPDGQTANGVSLHRGRVRRWVSNGMATLEDCWILFVDDYDNKGGNVKAKQGAYFGPARLSGVSTAGGTMLPVYAVKHGNTEADEELVEFRLTEDLSLGSGAEAVLTLSGLTVTVIDPYGPLGCWQAYTGDKGLARITAAGEYKIVFMERPALFMEGTTYTTRDPVAVTVPTIHGTYFQQGGRLTPAESTAQGSVTFYDSDILYPRALVGGKSRAVWNDVRQRRELLVCQQMGLLAWARLNQDIGAQFSSQDISINSFAIITFSPFNLTPNPIPNKAYNLLNLYGENGDTILLAWIEPLAQWIIVQVDKPEKLVELVKVDVSSASAGHLVEFDGNGTFSGRVINHLPDGSHFVGRPCEILFNDFGEGGNPYPLVAVNHRIYGPGKWAGRTSDNKPLYACTIGEQQWEGKCSTDRAKGQDGDFTLLNGDGSDSAVVVSANCRWNPYKANKRAVVNRLNNLTAGFVANQVEC